MGPLAHCLDGHSKSRRKGTSKMDLSQQSGALNDG